MFQNTDGYTWPVYTGPTRSIENVFSANSSSQDSSSSSMSDKVPSPDSTNTSGKPYLKIIEEPANQFRFRYKSEMQGTHGAILGVNASKSEKTFPTVKLFNYEGEAVIRCTLYTAEKQRRRPHVHRLVGKLSGRAEKDDPHDLRIGQRVNHTASFQNLVIIHTAKKVLVDELLSKKKRIAEARFTKKLNIEESLLAKMRLEAEQDAKGMNMNSVSLKFEAFSLVNQQYIQICEPVYSQPINNMKSHVTGQLRICRLSKFYSSCEGGDEILLFVEKVGKNNIKVLFTEFDDYGNEIWRDYATHVDVHHQFGISCRCPKYKSQDISREVCVKMQLERPSDGATSETRDFFYKPKEYSNTATKRRRLDSTAFSPPQIPDSTCKLQMNTIEPLGPTESCTASSSIVLQSSNTDPLSEIREPLQDEDDFVMLKIQDTLLSSHVQDEAMNVHANEENASSFSAEKISFSAEIGKIPTPPESMIPFVYSSEELQKAFPQELPLLEQDYGELVPDSVSTRNLKPPAGQSSLENLLTQLLSDFHPNVWTTAGRTGFASILGGALRMQAAFSIPESDPGPVRPQSGLFTLQPQAERYSAEHQSAIRHENVPTSPPYVTATSQGPEFKRREDVLLSLFSVGVDFLQSIFDSVQMLIAGIRSSNAIDTFTEVSDQKYAKTVEGLMNSIVNRILTDGVEYMELGVELTRPLLSMIRGVIPIIHRSISSTNYKKDGFWLSLYENLPEFLQAILLEEPFSSMLSDMFRDDAQRRSFLGKIAKENQRKWSPKDDFWIAFWELLPEGFKNILREKLPKSTYQQPKSTKQQSTQTREKPSEDESKKEHSSKRSPKVHAKDFAEYSLERLHQIVDTAVFPHVTKADVEKKLFMELYTRTAKGDSVLHTAVRHQQFTLLKRLLECIKSHIDDPSPIVNCPNTWNRQTPLHVAVQSNDTDQSRQIVEYLLDLGADPNRSDISEFTPLHLAVKERNFYAAKCLLEYPGVNINQASANLGTALHIAAEQNSCEMAVLLIQHGADINGIDLQSGQTPLHVAVKRSHVQIVDLLLKQADINIDKEDYRGQTPLKFAVLDADTRLMKIVNKLINHGATYESVNIEEEIDDSLESVQEDDTKTTKCEKMQKLAFLFSQISVTENDDS